MLSFIHNRSDIRLYRVVSGNKLDDIIAISLHNSLVKNVFTSFDGDAEKFLRCILIYLPIPSAYVYNSYP